MKQEVYFITFFTLAILPIIGFVFIPFMNYSLVADHWLYFGMIPLCVLTMLLLTRLEKKYSIAIVSLFILFWSYQSLSYIHLFNHRYKLLERTIETVPDDYRFHMELATTLLNDKKLTEAQKVIEAALKRAMLKNNMTLLLQGAYIDRQLGHVDKLALKIVAIGSFYFENGDTKNGNLMIEQLKEISSNQTLLNRLKASRKKENN